MTTSSPTISICLPAASRLSLDKATKLTRRSSSFLMQEALDRHLAEIIQEQSPEIQKPRLTKLLALGGKGLAKPNARSAKEIDQHVRWLREIG